MIHLGQRDWAETVKYRSPDIRKTRITCMSLEDVRINGLHAAYDEVLHSIRKSEVEEYWIHFDTDVLSDEINPAVDYRLPGGLLFEEAEYLMGKMMKTGIVAGISVTIFNPVLDEGGLIAKNIAESLGRAFNFIRH